MHFICALLALIVLSPSFLVGVIIVRTKLGSPVIFKQERPGKTGKVFTLYKFRSMTDKCDVEGKLLPDSKRLTRFGKLLRFTNFDKITEILDILKGDMAVVGPWPLLTACLSLYNEQQTT